MPAETLEQTSEPTPTLTSTPILWATATAQFNESSIREAFEQYRTALINKDGESALGIIYSLHVEWYEQLLTDALNLEYSELNSLELIQKFLILRLRHEFSQEELQSLKGEDVIIISVERGWLGLANIEQLEISEIDVGLSPGDAFVTFEGLPPSAGILFIREGGRHWKVSLYHFQRQGNEELEQLIKESRLPEDEYFSSLLEFLSDKQVDERIFNGPIE